MKLKKPLTKIQMLRLKVLLNNFIDGLEPNTIVRNYHREYRRVNVPGALLKNPECNGIGGSWMLL